MIDLSALPMPEAPAPSAGQSTAYMEAASLLMHALDKAEAKGASTRDEYLSAVVAYANRKMRKAPKLQASAQHRRRR